MKPGSRTIQDRNRLLTGVLTLGALTAAFASCPATVHAQQGAFGVTTSSPTNLPSLARTTDVFVGRDNPGPYALNWKKLPVVGGENAPVVNVDGRQLRANEFTVDFDKGVITFTAPLKQSSFARVDYGRDPALSERNQNPASAPITVPLFKAGGAAFQLTAVPTGAAAAPSAAQSASKTRAMSLLGAVSPGAVNSQQMPDTTLVLGGGGRAGILGGGLTSQLYLSPQVKDAKGDGIQDRAGLSLGYDNSKGRLGLNAAWSRAGRDFASTVGKAVGMGDAAQQKQVLGLRYNASAWMGVEWGQTEVRSLLDGAAAGSTGQEKLAMRFGGTKNAPTLNLLRVEDTRTDAKGVLTAVKTEKADLAAKLGPGATLTARTQQVSTDAADAKQDTTAGETALALSAQSKDKTQAASVAYNTATKETASAIQDNQSVQVRLQPSPSVTLTAEQQQQTVTPVVAPAKDKPAEPDPSKAKETSMQAARAEIALAPGAKVVTGVRVNAVGDDKTAATEMGAQFGIGKNVDIAQTLVNRSASEGVKNPAMDLNTQRTQIALRPSKTLTLTGALTTNPENNGVPLEAKRQEFGLKTKLGSLDLGSSYAITSLAAADDAQTGEFSLTLGVTFDKRTRLTGAYKDALLWGVDEESKLPRGVRVYTLGLTHNLGDALNFSFGGSVTENKQDTTVPNDIKAEAKLGVKF